jgi:hypothetical protein
LDAARPQKPGWRVNGTAVTLKYIPNGAQICPHWGGKTDPNLFKDFF